MIHKIVVAGLLLMPLSFAQSNEVDKYFADFQRIWAAETIRDKVVRAYGNFAVITFSDGEGTNATRRTIVWSKSPDGWKVVSLHAGALEP